MQKMDGNSIDAAIASLFCLGLVQPESSGLGGGGFLVYRQHRKKNTTTVNFRETAPQFVDADAIASQVRPECYCKLDICNTATHFM